WLGAINKALAHLAQLASVLERTMLQNPLAGFKTQVQTIEGGVTLFQLVHDTQTLQIMLKAPRLGAQALHAAVQGVLTCVTKWGVAQIMGQGDGFDKIFVQAQIAGNGPRQLSHFQTMRQSCSE